MEAKKVTITCKNCGQQMDVDFNTAHFSSEIQIMNGKKRQKRTYIAPCPECQTINTVTSENKEDWGKRKGPNIKYFMFSGMFSCLLMILFAIVVAYFAFKGLGMVIDWIFG